METALSEVGSERTESTRNWTPHVVYGLALALAVAISVWLLAIRAPLYLDETGSYWLTRLGPSRMWADQFHSPACPAYYYILWLATKILGTSEVALRIPSVLAMLGAVYLLYLAAREMLDRETSLVAAIVFCIHPIIIFASTNVRPYAFAVLATNAAIFVLLRLRKNDSNWLAALFGFSAVSLLYWHYLFGSILPALVICFFIVKRSNGRAMWRQFGIATATFMLAFLPLIPGLLNLFNTGETHVIEGPPKFSAVLWTLAPGWLPFIFLGTALVAIMVAAATTPPRDSRTHSEVWKKGEGWKIGVCASLAFIPLLILYGVSVGTSLHMFADIHRTEAVPGIALCWGLVIGRFRQTMRLLFCMAIVMVTAVLFVRAPASRQPEHTLKYGIEAVEKNASVDGAPVVVCSDYPESDYVPMPIDSAKSSRLFAPLSYYKLSVPVVPLPMRPNAEAIRVGSQFLDEATRKHERFLAMGDAVSYETLNWLAKQASEAYEVHRLGVFDKETEVLEFDPRVK